MPRKLTFDESVAYRMYYELKSDAEIEHAIGKRPGAIASWRKRRNLPSIAINHRTDETWQTHQDYRKVLTPTQAKEMSKFLRALAEGYRRCEERGVKPDVIGAIKAWGNIPRTKQERAITIGFMAREKKNKGVS